MFSVNSELKHSFHVLHILSAKTSVNKNKQNIVIPPQDNFTMFETQQSADFSAEIILVCGKGSRIVVQYWPLSECGVLS
jgi:3-mercaptopyruvate sulfurtransferase SseA